MLFFTFLLSFALLGGSRYWHVVPLHEEQAGAWLASKFAWGTVELPFRVVLSPDYLSVFDHANILKGHPRSVCSPCFCPNEVLESVTMWGSGKSKLKRRKQNSSKWADIGGLLRSNLKTLACCFLRIHITWCYSFSRYSDCTECILCWFLVEKSLHWTSVRIKRK